MFKTLVLSLSLGALLVPAWAGVSGDPAPAGGVLRPAPGEWCARGTVPEPDATCIVPPVLVHAVPPMYPELAKKARFTGRVDVEAIVDTFGDVVAVRVLRANPVFEAAAISAVRARRYTPASRKGEPVTVSLPITVRFELVVVEGDRRTGSKSAGAEVIRAALEERKSPTEGRDVGRDGEARSRDVRRN